MEHSYKFKFFTCCLIFILNISAAIAQNLSTVINANIPASGMNLTLNSVTLFNTATGSNISAMRDSVFKNWVYPNGVVVGASAIVSNVYKMGEQTGLDTALVSNHYSFLTSGTRSLQSGDKLYICSYTLIDSTYGTFNFTTIGYEDGSGNAKFEPFFYMCPLHHSNYIKVTKPGAAHDVEFSVTNVFGAGASGWGDCVITCDGETVVDCFGLVGGDASFLWEYKTTKDCATIGKCCRCIFYFGFANGFSSVGVGADGFTIELSGSFGWKGSTEAVVKRCCPSGAVVAFNFVPQTSGTSEVLLSVCAVSESTGWVAGSSGTVRRTTDGGNTWTHAGTGITGDVVNINALDANTAFCTTSPSATIIYKTMNGGANWTPVFNQPGGFIDAIQMISPSIGYALGDPVGGKWTVLKTTNSGNTWQRMATEPTQIGTEAGWNNSFRIIGNHMWFGTNDNRVYHSFDLGLTWNFAPTPGTVSTFALHYNSLAAGLAGGTGMVRSTNGGLSYNIASMPSSIAAVYGIEGFGNEWWSIGNGPSIYNSINNGSSWSSVYTYTLESVISLYAIDLTIAGGDVSGWIVGSSGEIIRMGSVSLDATLSLKTLIEGFYNSGTDTQVGDTIKAYLRNTFVPYAVVDSANAYMNSAGMADLNFSHAPAGSYYIVVDHRNSIETWSSAGVSFTPGSITNYDFTTLSSQSYGSNLKLKGTKWCIYSGDVLRNGSVELSDVLEVYNKSSAFTTGYVNTDVNGDNIVDLSDITITFNNAINFVTVIKP